MTKEKVKSYLEHMLEMMAIEPPESLLDERDIKEWEDEHSKIRETLEFSLIAVEMQIPKKPTHMVDCRRSTIQTLDFDRIYQCSNCHAIVKEEWNYCTLCGQKLDWEEGEIK